VKLLKSDLVDVGFHEIKTAVDYNGLIDVNFRQQGRTTKQMNLWCGGL